MPFTPNVRPFHGVLNNANSTAAGALNNTDNPVTFSVASGEGANFPQPTTDGNFLISIDSEILNCTARTVDSLVCDRAQDGTTIASHVSGAAVELRIVALALTELHNAVTLMLEAWVLDDAVNPTMGTIPADAFVYAVDVYVQEVFNSSGSDLLDVGFSADPNAYVAALDASVLGATRIFAGEAAAGVQMGQQDTTSRSVEILYTPGVADQTTGRALVVFHYILTTVQPA